MYRAVDDAMMLRAALLRPDRLDPWPDLISSDSVDEWRRWLTQTLSTIPGFSSAVAHASPDLVARAAAVINGGVSRADAQAVTFAFMRYLLRATTRATPFGLFAGVAPVTASRSGSVRWGTAHQAVVRIQAAWLTAVIERLESDAGLRPHLMLRANNLLVERADKVVLEYRADTSDPRGAPAHLRIEAKAAIRAALVLAADPIRCADLIDKLIAGGSGPREGAERLIGQMIAQRLLLTHLRPPSTETDPLAYLVRQLAEIGADSGAGQILDHLARIRDLKERHDQASNSSTADVLRREIRASAAVLQPGSAVGVDLRVDCDLVLPTAVTAEAGRAAAALTRLARPASAGWQDWHARFLNRYGLHALVPILDTVDAQVGLGYPAGLTGMPADAAPVLTGRDRRLIAVAQDAALRRQHEVILDEALVEELAGTSPAEIAPSAELTVRVHAGSLQDVEEGDFHLSVVRASSQAFTTAGRFLDLFDESTRRQMATGASDSPPASTGALLAQLSSVTRYTISLDVNRAARTLPHVIPVGEFTAGSQMAIGLNDIAVTADAHRLYLVSVSRRRALHPIAVNAVEPVRHAHPLARFLAEAPAAFAAKCSPVEWGPAAKALPFLPALRYGRTLLSPARWLLRAEELPGRTAPWKRWEHALDAWREVTACPAAVMLGIGDQTLGLDLNESAHRALLRDHLTRNPTALLRLVPAGDGWLGGHRHEIVIPLTATAPRPPAPRAAGTPIDVRTHGTLPGSDHLYLKIYAQPGDQSVILSTHVPRLLAGLPDTGTWWFLRHADPEPHLRLRVTGLPLDAVIGWTRELAEADLTRRVQWDTDFGEPGRFGGPDAYRATTAVFAADSAAALAQLAVTERRAAPGWQPVTAASMVDLVTAVVGDPAEALRWLIARTRTHRPAPPRHIYDQAVLLSNPYDRSAVLALSGGRDMADRWSDRRLVLSAWRARLPAVSAIPPAELLPDLLHLHHARVAGLDLDSERACLHLARAAALSWTTRSAP
ncbi:thiopeptide-type bacteriocin biosynthesis protein [Catenuloplanes nepalensis]|uniref:Thiopeptide-type bacteriocin biosynthesis protein n=1 Tax=Catenuloplanes nepalensis TaxID=587533 RepID=A0ABT9MM75_9ACTN|nr:lantibiotic dehydratase [Catenuloplanes nepalensis]MDP9792522.1 thiopeptide-type bacteriocin biosynthesis protein [Catenuloplanes nepalensis]